MELNNFRQMKKYALPAVKKDESRYEINKKAEGGAPRISFILLDWNVRYYFQAIEWLNRQSISRDLYELIWVELYDRMAPEALSGCDIHLTCHQKGLYHKHKGYNAGLLEARGDVIIICDSDAVFPARFVESVLDSFQMHGGREPIELVLLHHQWRTSFHYPDHVTEEAEIADAKWQWWDLNPNAGACVTFRKKDALRFGGFDEDDTYLGYICGPYELAWRLVNAGIEERWHDPSIALWHFAHPDPVGVNGIRPNLKLLKENTYPHVDFHAFTAVEAFSTGRIMPLKENAEIWQRRMASRRIGTEFEAKYSNMTTQRGFSYKRILLLRGLMLIDTYYEGTIGRPLRNVFRPIITQYRRYFDPIYKKLVLQGMIKPNDKTPHPKLVSERNGYNIIFFQSIYYAIPHHLGAVDVYDHRQLSNKAIKRALDVETLQI